MSPTSHALPWSKAERSKGPIHAAPSFPDQRGARIQVSRRLCRHWAQRRGSPFPRHASDRPNPAYLSWRCTHRTTQLKSHPSASLPRVPAKRGARKPGGNKCAWILRRAGHEAAKLASGRRGRWLGKRRVLRSGIAPRKAAPAAPPPARPPPRAAAARGSGPGPRCGCARLGAGAGARGSATPAGCSRRWDRVLLLRSPTCEDPAAGAEAATTRSAGTGVPGRAADRETLKTPGAPSASRAPARPSWPRHCLWLCFAAAVGAAEVATVHPGRDEEPPSPREWAFPPRGNPDPGGATERAQPLPGKQLLGIRSGDGEGRGDGLRGMAAESVLTTCTSVSSLGGTPPLSGHTLWERGGRPPRRGAPKKGPRAGMRCRGIWGVYLQTFRFCRANAAT